MKKIDLTGQRFGRLVVIKQEEERKGKGRSVIWECECDCGNIKKVTRRELTSGDTRSCGCLHKEKIRKDLSGMSFGRLTALTPIKDKTKQRRLVWECICECGNNTIVSSASLLAGLTRSCGCLSQDISKENSGKAHEFHRNSSWKEGTSLPALTSKKPKNNTSGHKGIYWNKKNGKWCASITFKQEKIFLGYFHNKQDAINARKEAEDKYFKPILEKYNKN